jgi:hypothetical protein
VHATTAQYTTGLVIGGWGLGGREYNGDMCEILIFNRSLSSREMKLVHTYLGQKWGVGNTDRSIIDLSGNNNHGLLGNGTVANMPVADYYNKFSLRFDGVNDSINCGQGSSMQLTTDITVEAWIYITSSPNDWVRIIGSGSSDGSPTNRTFGLWYYGPTRYLLWQRLGGSNPNIYVTSTQLNLNTWYHVTATTSGTAHVLYLNGVSIGTATAGGPWAWSNENVTIGYAGYHTYHNGFISNAKLYNRGLSATEVFQNYQAQKSRFDNTIVQQGLVLNLDADNPYSYGGAGTTWYDVSGNNYNHSLNNSSLTVVDNVPCFNVSSANSYIVDAGSTFTLGSSHTLIAWARPLADSQVSTWRTLWRTLPDDHPLLIQDGTNTIGYFDNNSAGFVSYGLNAGTLGIENKWTMFTVVGSGGSSTLYINDGIVSGSVAYSAAGLTHDSIGSTNSGTQAFGYVSSAYVYANQALSLSQIQQNYNATKGRFGL